MTTKTTETVAVGTPEAEAYKHTSIHSRLTAVMEEVGAVGKTDRNAQQGFNFRGVDAVVKAVAPALRRYGITVMPQVLDKSREVGTTRNGGAMETVYLTVQFTLHGPDGDSIVGSVAAQANDTADKATAKAMSVAYRTFWLQALCIPTDEPDPDSSYTERGLTPAPSMKTTAEMVSEMLAASSRQEVRDLWQKNNFGGAPREAQDKVQEHAMTLPESA